MKPSKQPKFLVDLKNRVFVSEKPHQEIIDDNGLDPAGYDNYFKGWVNGSDAKVWVEQVEDVVFRYWDQARVGFKELVSEKLLTPRSRTYAVVNNSDKPIGTVADFLGGKTLSAFANNQIGVSTAAFLPGKIKAGSLFRLRSTLRIGPNRYLPRDTVGKLLKDVKGQPPKYLLRWARSISGNHRPMAAISYAVDARILLHVR
jgi:hypothetical protein